MNAVATVWINGRDSRCIDVADRGFQYGDGVFETLPTFHRTALFLSQHLARLALGCSRLGIPAPPPALLLREIDALLRLPETRVENILKIQITRGIGGRGYRSPKHPEANRILSLHPQPAEVGDWAENGIRLRLCRMRLAENPHLAGIKHMNRLEQVLARQEWQDPCVHEGLLQSQSGFVIEGTMSNLFVLRQNRLLTPALDRCGVAGIIRTLILEEASQRGVSSQVGPVTLTDVCDADELVICNSVIGVCPVRQFETRHYSPGPLTRRIQQWIDTRVQRELSQP